MKYRILHAFFTLSLLSFLILTLGGPPPLAVWGPGRASAQSTGSLYFEPTGQYLEGQFLNYWQTHGGLPVFGYPLTTAFRENGYLTQYFERARFELHPEHAGTPFEVLLGQLGTERLALEEDDITVSPLPPDAVFFPETGFSVNPTFLNYWQSHGGLSQFGYPISQQYLDPQTNLIVQYFERARFELHPEHKGTPYEVLLTLLGVERASSLDPLLRAPWPKNLLPVDLRLVGSHTTFNVLDTVSVRSNLGGELIVLGGDNRPYARYRLEADQDFQFTLAGMWGEQSLVFTQNGAPAAALWGALNVAMPVWGLQSGDLSLDSLYTYVERFLANDAVDYLSPDDKLPVHGYRSPDNIAIWLRDHVYQSKGFKYFEPDMISAINYFGTTQRPDGSYDDYLYHQEATPIFTDQIEIEPDREFLFVEGAFTAWQATGDDQWLRDSLLTMERGMAHLWGDPRRWSSEYGLIKRAFTIDTWDFEQGSDMGHVRRYIDDKTKWSIMHGDNTGASHAARTLAYIERYLGRETEAQLWEARAASLSDNINLLAWNGKYYTHQVHLTPIDSTGVDESLQLSLSNAYALNRGTLSYEQAVALIQTYQERRVSNQSKAFAEWYSIDPSFPLGFGPQGEYVNGGIMPLVGGELARGALDHGYESYGIDILRRYRTLIERDNGSFLWYHPDGSPGISSEQTLNTDGWGSSAMLSALTEGLAGIIDRTKLYQDVTLAPRWAADCGSCTGRTFSTSLQYPASGAYFSYNLRFTDDGSINLSWGGRRTTATYLHLLLPPSFTPNSLQVNDLLWAYTLNKVGGSTYLDATLPGHGELSIK